jgi:hypothetical protein
MPVLVVAIMLLFASSSSAAVIVGNCPEVFEGRVKVKIEEIGPQSAFSKEKVIFTNLQTIKGNVSEEVEVDVLINGPFKLDEGKDYRVQLRKGKICWIDQL